MAGHALPQQILHSAEKSLSQSWIHSALQILGASLLIAFFAQIRIPLPFTPIPFTGQTLGILFVAAVLGSRKGTLSVLLYLAEAAMGLPVLTGGNCGWLYMLGPTGGYMVGFVAQSALIGWFFETERPEHSLKTLAVLLFGCLCRWRAGSCGSRSMSAGVRFWRWVLSLYSGRNP